MPEIAPLEAGEPQRLGPFRIVGRIGEGGQGVVYLGMNTVEERVAIKLLHVKFSGDASARSRFAREARAAQRVASFCTAAVLGADLEGDTPYIASEYIEGRSLRAVVEDDGPLRGAALQRLAIGTATALTAIHQAAIAHLDFKPDNVLMAADGPRVVDFGIARILDSTGTITSRAIGTPAYMAPEQISGSYVGPETDIFAWGATIVFAATGETAFSGTSIAVVLNRILNHDPDLSSMPEPLRGVVRSALAKKHQDRPSADRLLLRLLGHPDAANASPAILTQGVRIATPKSRRDDDRDDARDRGGDSAPARGDDGRDRIREGGQEATRPREDEGEATSPIRAPKTRQVKPRTGAGTGVSPQEAPASSAGSSPQQPSYDQPIRLDRPIASNRPVPPAQPAWPPAPAQSAQPAQPAQPAARPPQPAQPARPPQPAQSAQSAPPVRENPTGQDARRPSAYEESASGRGPAAGTGDPVETFRIVGKPSRGPAVPSRGPAEHSPESTELVRGPADRPRSTGRADRPGVPGYLEHPVPPGYQTPAGYPSQADVPPPSWQAGVQPPSWQAEPVGYGVPAAPTRRRRGRWIAAGVAVVLVAVAAVAAVRWWPRAEPGVNTTGPDASTSMLDRAAKTRKLTVGLRDGLPGIALRNTDGTWSGFEVDLALEIAKALGVPESGVTFQATTLPDRPKLLADGDVDMVLATYSINDTDDVTFAGPYYLAHVDVLVKDGSRILAVNGLKGKRLCQPASSASVAVVQRKAAPLTLVPAQHYTDCINKLQADQVDAIPGDDLLLAGFANRESTRYKVLGAKLTDERYAVALKQGDTRGCETVSDVIADLYRNGTMGRLLDRHFSKVKFAGRENTLPPMAPCA